MLGNKLAGASASLQLQSAMLRVSLSLAFKECASHTVTDSLKNCADTVTQNPVLMNWQNGSIS